MPQTISPYALLRASKPKPAPTVTTSYDLYSAAYQSAVTAPAPAQETAVSPDLIAMSSPAPAAVQGCAYPPTKKTHYIADIKSRHNAASRHARMSPPASLTSLQTPST